MILTNEELKVILNWGYWYTDIWDINIEDKQLIVRIRKVIENES